MTSTFSATPQPTSVDSPVNSVAGRGRAICSRADVSTGTPARYAKQLISHLGRKVSFAGDGVSAPATAVIGGATADIVVGDGVLGLRATGDDEASVVHVEQVLGSHLERFAHRESLTVRWVRTGTVPVPASGAFPSALDLPPKESV
jgi:hypothetical protein